MQIKAYKIIPEPAEKRHDLTGRRFGSLVVVNQALTLEGVNKHLRWNCICDCGGTTTSASYDLRSGHTVSCGCKKYSSIKAAQLAHANHRMSTTVFYKTWAAMKSRCLDPGHRWYYRYGGRGITVCERWFSFENFLEDMYQSYAKGLQLDRINNDLGYSKENCRWTTSKQNNRNRENNVVINTPLGPMSISEASEKFSVGATTINYRINAGWPEERWIEKARPMKDREVYRVIKIKEEQ